MNSMELVRFPTRGTRPPQGPTKKSPPPFCSELVGPVRNAIVRARHLLVTQQRSDGSWHGQPTGDVSLASQLVFLLTFLERDHSELAHQCAAPAVPVVPPHRRQCERPGLFRAEANGPRSDGRTNGPSAGENSRTRRGRRGGQLHPLLSRIARAIELRLLRTDLDRVVAPTRSHSSDGARRSRVIHQESR